MKRTTGKDFLQSKYKLVLKETFSEPETNWGDLIPNSKIAI